MHRKLARTADHRASLLRNLVTNVLEHESITTTHAKAQEAQIAVERLITAAKRYQANKSKYNKEELNRRTQLLQNRFYKPNILFPKLIDELAERYKDFNGGYTRVLKLENRLGDNAPQSILEFVGGKTDMKMSMTAKVVARSQALGEPLSEITLRNVKKMEKIQERFDLEVEKMKNLYFADIKQGEKRGFVEHRKAPIKLVPNPLK